MGARAGFQFLREKRSQRTLKSAEFEVLGLAGRNIGGGIEFVQEEDPLPTVYDFGISSALRTRGADVLNLSGYVVLPSDADLYFAGGLEYGFYRALFLRAGYNGSQEADDGFTLGLGVHDQRFKINYSFQAAGNLGNNQRLTLSYIVGGIELDEEETDEGPEGGEKTTRDQRRRNGLWEELNLEENHPYLKPSSEKKWLAERQMGKQAYRNGNYVKARNHFLRAYRTKPADLQNLLWLGTMEWYLGRREWAVRHMKQVLRVDPDNEVAK